MFKTARYFAYNKHKLRFYCYKISILFTFHEREFHNHRFYNDTTVDVTTFYVNLHLHYTIYILYGVYNMK